LNRSVCLTPKDIIMELRIKALNYIYEHRLFDEKDHLILGLSGGADSMALAHFLKAEGYSFTIAHCNFQLRNESSDLDQQLVEDWSRTNGVDFRIKSFDTKAYSKRQKISVEMAARKLRYDWFEDLAKELDANAIAVAHHVNDQVETFFLNILRGSGIKGCKGMNPRNGNVVRPFLQITKPEIEEYVTQNKIPFRDDETNLDTTFLRNAIRHRVVPELEKINPSFIDIMNGNIKRIAGVWSFLEMHFIEMERKMVKKSRDIITIQLPNEKQSHIYLDFLNYLFTKENFNFPMTEIQSIIDGQVGKYVKYKGYVLNKERGYLSISPIVDNTNLNVEINEIPYVAEFGEYEFYFKYVKPQGKNSIPTIPDIVWLNLSEKDLPMSLRVWQSGDAMKPFGMTGTKKIKKMLTDSHVPSSQRKNYPVLFVNQKVAWLPGIRPGRDYIVTGNEEQVLEIRVTYKESK